MEQHLFEITGQLIKDLGYKPEDWWKQAIGEAKGSFYSLVEAKEYLDSWVKPKILLREFPTRWEANIDAEDELERDNILVVKRHMDELMRLPTVVAGAIMPDACPSDHRLGAIPVGGVAATKEAIHPGMHSADICCSMAISIFKEGVNPTALLDAGMKHSHFGGGGRPRGQQLKPPSLIMQEFQQNQYLYKLTSMAQDHFGTQGDGNHFFYVGRLASTGQIALVTHHGSRGPGANLYKIGMSVAEKFRRKISPETPEHNAWIPSETTEGEEYWKALQIIRGWTKASHFAIHNLVADVVGGIVEDSFWNEHNFVFRKSDGLFYHAKGATPAYNDYAMDASGLTLIPLNMAEPILITKGKNAANGLGFAPHGAGRNFSRTNYMKQNAGKTEAEMIQEQAPGIDVRYFCGIPDVSELPMAYKNAASVRRQIDKYGLAEVVDTVEPIGSIGAGDWQRDAPWKKAKAEKKRLREKNDQNV